LVSLICLTKEKGVPYFSQKEKGGEGGKQAFNNFTHMTQKDRGRAPQKKETTERSTIMFPLRGGKDLQRDEQKRK